MEVQGFGGRSLNTDRKDCRAIQDELGADRNRAMAGNLKYKFSGHQTFVFRYGWLEKGVRGVAACSTLFSEDDALVRLGVGKNMVDSIRHWCQVTQLVEPDPEIQGNTRRHLRATDIPFACAPCSTASQSVFGFRCSLRAGGAPPISPRSTRMKNLG